jgi:sugar phosphate isomerase/epimerase
MVRVFGGRIPDGVDFTTAEGWVVEGLKRLGDYAAARRVFVLLETHDSFIRTDVVRAVVEKAGSEWVRVLWDVHHPFRMEGESIRQSWDNIGPYVVHTHFKDSRAVDSGGHELTLMGEGDVPVREALAVLKKSGYRGYLSLEWEKRWHPELPDATVAFPQYAARMREYLSQLP